MRYEFGDWDTRRGGTEGDWGGVWYADWVYFVHLGGMMVVESVVYISVGPSVGGT